MSSCAKKRPKLFQFQFERFKGRNIKGQVFEILHVENLNSKKIAKQEYVSIASAIFAALRGKWLIHAGVLFVQNKKISTLQSGLIFRLVMYGHMFSEPKNLKNWQIHYTDTHYFINYYTVATGTPKQHKCVLFFPWVSYFKINDVLKRKDIFCLMWPNNFVIICTFNFNNTIRKINN